MRLYHYEDSGLLWTVTISCVPAVSCAVNKYATNREQGSDVLGSQAGLVEWLAVALQFQPMLCLKAKDSWI